ncbi:MAG: glycosyltransferase family 87 protein [Thermoguttaceae bacterium]
MKHSSANTAMKWLIPMALAIGVSLIYARRDGDFTGYTIAGNLQMEGRDAYRDAPTVCPWPPLFYWCCVPLAWASNHSFVGARWVWLLSAWAALGWTMFLIVRLVYDRRLMLARPPTVSRDEVLDVGDSEVWLPLLLCSVWIASNFQYLQVNIFIFALAITGLWFHRRGCELRAGVFLGAGAALKVLPICFVPYFLWRRQWKAALATGGFAVGWSLLPAVTLGWRGLVDRLQTWHEILGKDLSVGAANLSIYAMFDRWIGQGLTPFVSPGSFAFLHPSHHPAVVWAAVALILPIALVGAWLFRGPYDRTSRTATAEWSTVFLAAALFGSLTWKHYLVVLLLPMTLFVATWRDERVDEGFRRRLRLLTWLAFLPSLSGANDLIGSPLAMRLQTGSLLTLMGIFLIGVLYWYVAKMKSVQLYPSSGRYQAKSLVTLAIVKLEKTS